LDKLLERGKLGKEEQVSKAKEIRVSDIAPPNHPLSPVIWSTQGSRDRNGSNLQLDGIQQTRVQFGI
jgi:hypothetical protein